MSRPKREKGSQTDRQKEEKEENCDTVAIPIMTLTGLQLIKIWKDRGRPGKASQDHSRTNRDKLQNK